MRFSYLDEDGKVVGFYELNSLPGSNQVLVSNHAWISPEYRGKGLGQKLHQQRLDKARELGYDYITCTVLATNFPQIHILELNSWLQLDQFKNRETENTVYLYGRKL